MQVHCPYFQPKTFPDAFSIAICDTPGAGFELAHNQNFNPVEWRCELKIITRARRKMTKTY